MTSLRKKHSPNSAAGNDEIPYAAYRAIEDFTAHLIILLVTSLLSSLTDVPDWFNVAFMIFLPKEPDGCTQFGIPFYSPECTRPLSMVITFNKLVANTIRIALERHASSRISFWQRGFLLGRQILDNVVELDHYAHIFSMVFRVPALMLFDFKAAFPSVLHKYIWRVLDCSGIPQAFIKLIQCFYRNCRHVIRIGGQLFPGPILLSGVRQGCPLSGLLFAIVMEPILRCISAAMGPRAHLRAYADDVGVLVPDYRSVIPSLGIWFEKIALATGLFLNVKKTIFIPLWPFSNAENCRKMIQELFPNWKQISVQSCGKYLGFEIGPGSTDIFWKKAITKAEKNANQWHQLHLGFLFSVLAFNIYIASVFSYLGQLAKPGNEVQESCKKILRILFPGPGNWVTNQVLCSLTHLGFPSEVSDVNCIAKVSMLRYWKSTGLPIGDLAEDMMLHMKIYEAKGGMDHKFLDWHQNAFCLQLAANAQQCESDGITSAF